MKSIDELAVSKKEKILLHKIKDEVKKEWNRGLYLNHPIHKEVETEGVSL